MSTGFPVIRSPIWLPISRFSMDFPASILDMSKLLAVFTPWSGFFSPVVIWVLWLTPRSIDLGRSDVFMGTRNKS